MVFLSALRRRPDAAVDQGPFPLDPAARPRLETLEFTTPVTFLVGENGSGKSTLLEGIAAGMEAVAAGAHDLKRDPTLRPARDLAAGFVFVRRRHARTRLFLRAEDVFGYTGRVTADMADSTRSSTTSRSCPRDPAATARWVSHAANEGAGAALRRRSRRALAWRDVPGTAANQAGAERPVFPR